MIAQEHVRHLLNRPPPDGWEEMIANISMNDEDDWISIPDSDAELEPGNTQLSVIEEGSGLEEEEEEDTGSATSEEVPLASLFVMPARGNPTRKLLSKGKEKESGPSQLEDEDRGSPPQPLFSVPEPIGKRKSQRLLEK